jgi:hypothetical protein
VAPTTRTKAARARVTRIITQTIRIQTTTRIWVANSRSLQAAM